MTEAIAPERSNVGRSMQNSIKVLARALAVPLALVTASSPARAGVGDLLVAPTRIVLDGRRGTEILLNNIGDEPATYRISVEFRRMTPEGGLTDVVAPSPEQQAAADMIVYAPRRVTLAPHQPQSVRVLSAQSARGHPRVPPALAPQ